MGIAAGSAMTARDPGERLSSAGTRLHVGSSPILRLLPLGPVFSPGAPYRDPGNPMSIAKVAGLGQDNEAILTELAGLSPAEIGELESEGVVFGAAPGPMNQGRD